MTYTSPLDGAAFDEPYRSAPGDAGQLLLEHYDTEHRGKPRAELDGRRAECIARAAELKGYGRLSGAQAREADDLIAEQIIIDDLIKQSDVEARRSKIADLERLRHDPANCEAPDSGSHPGGKPGAPALVANPGTRVESPQETLQRMRSDPWRGPDGDPLAGHTSYGRPGESAAGFVSRANTALEGLEERLTRPGAELLSSLLTERRDTPGVCVRRSADEVREAAEMIVALSSPYYESAMRSVFRNPDLFHTGLGAMVWSDPEREAVHAVITITRSGPRSRKPAAPLGHLLCLCNCPRKSCSQTQVSPRHIVILHVMSWEHPIAGMV
jgi:hypothetical protein